MTDTHVHMYVCNTFLPMTSIFYTDTTGMNLKYARIHDSQTLSVMFLAQVKGNHVRGVLLFFPTFSGSEVRKFHCIAEAKRRQGRTPTETDFSW